MEKHPEMRVPYILSIQMDEVVTLYMLKESILWEATKLYRS